TSFDAVLIGRHSVHLITLTDKQQIAGDVSGNGTVTAYDAGLVSQFAAQVVNHLPVATANASDWKFLRCDAYPFCTSPVYSYTPLTQPETSNFYALLYGDVSGNWAPATELLSSRNGSRTLPVEAEAIANDRVVAAELAGSEQVRVPRLSGPMSVHM